MSYRMARSTAKYGDAAINWKTLPPTQESADAIMVHPEAKTALEEIRNKPFAGTYAEQTRQIMQQLSIWWAANASRFTPEAARRRASSKMLSFVRLRNLPRSDGITQ